MGTGAMWLPFLHDRMGLPAGAGFTMCGKTLHCTMTMGVARHMEGQTAEMAVKCADDSLHHGKQNGKNRVVTCIPETDDKG